MTKSPSTTRDPLTDFILAIEEEVHDIRRALHLAAFAVRAVDAYNPMTAEVAEALEQVLFAAAGKADALHEQWKQAGGLPDEKKAQSC